MTDLKPSDLPTLFPDIDPSPPQEEPNPICSISYTSEFVVSYGYLRSVLRIDERSERTLRLTGLCLRLNPANYTVWHYRRRILGSLHRRREGRRAIEEEEKLPLPSLDGPTLRSELDLAASLGGDNPKNYQVWYHRRALFEPHLVGVVAVGGGGGGGGDGGGGDDDDDDDAGSVAAAEKMALTELAYVDGVLRVDGKNYHAWSHRQFLVRSVPTSSVLRSEYKAIDDLLVADVRNNSVWNHRWFIAHCTAAPGSGAEAEATPRRLPGDAELAREEAAYALSACALDPHNESPWRYLIGIVKEQHRMAARGSSSAAAAAAAGQLVRYAIEDGRAARLSLADGGGGGACPTGDAALVDLLDLAGDGGLQGEGGKWWEEAAGLAHSLGTRDDKIRRKYWSMRERTLREKVVE